MEDKEIKRKISQGYMLIRAIIEIVGKPKEHVSKSLEDQVRKIKDDSKYDVTKESLEEPVEQGNFFSTFAEIEVLMKDPKTVLSFCFDFMPTSVEILEPDRTILKSNDFSDFVNDLQARQHAFNKGIIELNEKNRIFVKNTAVLLRNFVVVLLSSRPMEIKQMTPYLGVKEEDIKKVLEVLIKEGKIKKDGNVYRAVQK